MKTFRQVVEEKRLLEDKLDDSLKDLMKDVKSGEGWIDFNYLIDSLDYGYNLKYYNNKGLVKDRVKKLGFSNLVKNM